SHVSHMSSSGSPAPAPSPTSPATTPASQIRFAANLTVPQEVPRPTGASGATGKWTASLNGTVLSWRLTVSHLSSDATASSIHAGRPGVVGRQLARLCGPCTSPASGKLHLTKAQIAALAGGLSYVNLGTAKHLNGEIRGQIRRVS